VGGGSGWGAWRRLLAVGGGDGRGGRAAAAAGGELWKLAERGNGSWRGGGDGSWRRRRGREGWVWWMVVGGVGGIFHLV